MEAFNKALLAKQCWRLIIKPDSLVARIFKAKYHRNEELIKAELGREPSYAWRSLVAGLEVLRKGLIKKIGNGGNTDLFRDPWIDRAGSFCVYSPRPPLADTLVRDFVIDENWDVNKLTLLFWPVDLIDVQRMAIPQVQSSEQDIWSWHFEDNGCYKVKSGYKVAMGELEGQGSQARASRHEDFGWMKAIWKLEVQSKIRFLLWKIARNILPTRTNLRRRQIIHGDTCPFCDASESSYHIFIECKPAAELWRRIMKFSTAELTAQAKHTGNWFGIIFSKFCYNDQVKFAACIQTLWTIRNEKNFKNKSYNPEQVFVKANLHLMELTTATSIDTPTTAATEGYSDQTSAPPNHSYNSCTLQVDGSWRYSKRIAGGGAIIFDKCKRITCALAKKFTWGIRAKEIEALAIEMGIDLAIDRNIKHLTVEGDAKILLNQISGRVDDNTTDRSTVKDIIDKIRRKSSFFTSLHWKWVPRDKNFRAHKLEALGLSLVSPKFWESDFPEWLLPLDESVNSVF